MQHEQQFNSKDSIKVINRMLLIYKQIHGFLTDTN